MSDSLPFSTGAQVASRNKIAKMHLYNTSIVLDDESEGPRPDRNKVRKTGGAHRANSMRKLWRRWLWTDCNRLVHVIDSSETRNHIQYPFFFGTATTSQLGLCGLWWNKSQGFLEIYLLLKKKIICSDSQNVKKTLQMLLQVQCTSCNISSSI